MNEEGQVVFWCVFFEIVGAATVTVWLMRLIDRVDRPRRGKE